MASRKISDLEPSLQIKCRTLVDKMAGAGFSVIITCTHRSNEEQDRLYTQGRQSPGHIVTNAKGGQSKHNKMPSEAFDIAILLNGKLDWDVNHPCWILARKIGEELGLRNLYPNESCHFELKI